jgi:plasmid replication initiation protein
MVKIHKIKTWLKRIFYNMGSIFMGLVVKSNELIRASYTLSLVEQRIILMSIVTARDITDITPDTLCHVRASDYAQLYDVSPQTAYEALKEAAEVMFNRRVTIQVYDELLKKKVPLAVRWLSGMNYLLHEGMVTVRFSKELIEHITEVYENFTRYKIENIAKLNSQYSIRLYELLVSWLSAGQTPLIELEDFRNQLGLGSMEYGRIQHFKERVLLPAIEQINENTDITISHKQHKAGRNIKGFSFTIKAKKKKTEPKKPSEAKKPVKEEQIDWVSPPINDEAQKIAEQFLALDTKKQAVVISHVKSELSGLKLSKFTIELDAFQAVGSKVIFQEYKDYFSRGLALQGSC